jgi:hypothetical protein
MMKAKFFLIIFPFVSLLLAGCAGMKECAKGIAGVSTKVLEDGRRDAVKKTFGLDYASCYTKVMDILTSGGAYIYAKNDHMIAIYVSEQDTTPVGLFFTEINKNATQIEISSPSSSAKEVISAKVFAGLEKKDISPPGEK